MVGKSMALQSNVAAHRGAEDHSRHGSVWFNTVLYTYERVGRVLELALLRLV
jgi:hypothetical protein